MVRVVSCHHFVSQDVFLSEHEPAAFCCAQEKLLVATTQHDVKVHDLDSRGNILHSFPTIDLVKQIIYCEAGNYIATIEKKTSWHRSPVTFVRVYFKWWIDVAGQTLKVRIGGCVPSSTSAHSWGNQFEMVELPLEETALFITCCKKTSAIAVSLGKVISVFCYCTKVHEASSQTFNDFEHFVDINMYFIVDELSMCENYFACMSNKIVQVFKIAVEEEDYVSNDQTQCKESEVQLEVGKLSCDSELYDENFIEWRFESCTNSGSNDAKWDRHLKSKLHPNSFPITINLRSIEKENENFSNAEECEIHGPLLAVRGCTMDVQLDSKVFEMFPSIMANLNAVTLLFRQFSSVENLTNLMGLQLIVFYESEKKSDHHSDPLSAAVDASEKQSFSMPWPNLCANGISHLKAVGCFFTTVQEGFLYDVTCKTNLINTYAYTATLKGVVLETTLLHALTETGLETYTLHLPHSAFQQIENVDGVKNAVPNYEDSVCLLGLRPFLGVDHLVISENHIILASSMEDSVANNESNDGNSCTLYSLKKPPPLQVFSDLLEMAEIHKSCSPSTYYHLLSEGHMILRTQLFLYVSEEAEIDALYKKSCTLMADYFVCSDSEDKLNAVPYYHLSGLPFENIIQRIWDLRSQIKHGSVLKPLIHYLNSVLLVDDNSNTFSTSHHVVEIILSAYSEEAPEMLWKIILWSKLSGYKIDKAILMLKRRMTSKRHPLSPISNAADTAALVSLLLRKGNTEAAQNMFLSLTKADLVTVLTSVHNILWDSNNLSTLGKFVKQVRPDVFVELLLNLVDSK